VGRRHACCYFARPAATDRRARERELQALRQQLESRQGHLSELTRRKEELQRQLQQVEKEVNALVGATPIEGAPPEPVTTAAPATPARGASRGVQPRLGELIVILLRESSGPRTARQLSEEARRRGYPLTSQNPIKSVEARLQDLKSQGVVRRASGQPGYLLTPDAHRASKDKSKARPSAQTKTPKSANQRVKPAPAITERSGKGSASSGTAQKTQPGRRGEQPPLREVLTGMLQNHRKPMTVGELAEQILASGYRTDSKKFVKVVRMQLRKMATVERVPDKGYRLKKKT
jgi:hypothetical protein